MNDEFIQGIQVQIQTLTQSIMGLASSPFGAEDVAQAVIELNMLKNDMMTMSNKVVSFIDQQITSLQTAAVNKGVEPNTFASKKNKMVKEFNLKTAQQVPLGQDPMGLNDPEIRGDQLDEQQLLMDEVNNPGPPWTDGSELKLWLDPQGEERASRFFIGKVYSNIEEYIRKELEQYFEGNLSENEKLGKAVAIHEILPGYFKPETGIMAREKTVAMNDINDIIKKEAETFIENQPKSFNLEKTAQSKTMDSNVIMYGPEQTQIDPFYRQPVSDWSIVERNKGFGLTVGDIWNIDWETIWRGAIMDKYSRPYRDKDGKWVGGYLNKRFEIDYNVPPASDMQLKPGQLRKPILPEYGNTESRLQAARAAGDVEGGPNVCRIDPYNWKEASSKKKIIK